MLLKIEIYVDYNIFLSEVYETKWELVDVPTKKIAKILAKRFGITTEQMYEILYSFEDYMDFSDYFLEDLEIQNLGREYYVPEVE